MNFFYYKSTNNYPALIFIAIVVAILLVQSAVNNHSEDSKSESNQTNQGPLHFAQARPLFEGFANNNLELKLSQPSNGNQVDVIRKEELLNDYQYLIDSTEEASVIIHDYYGNLLGTIQFDTTSQPLELFCLEGQNRVYIDFNKLRQINL
jgi:hypothetical protein